MFSTQLKLFAVLLFIPLFAHALDLIDEAKNYQSLHNDRKAHRLFLQEAKNGNPVGMAEVAKTFLFGKGVDKDVEESARWYSEAAKLGDIDSQLQMANYYLFGKNGFPKDVNKAKEWSGKAILQLTKKAREGHADSQFRLASLFRQGTIYTEQEKSQFWLKKTIETYTKQANQGSVEALYQLGTIYYEGKLLSDTKKDLPKAKKYFLEAAKRNHAPSMLSLAKLTYQYKDKSTWTESISWREKAAELGLRQGFLGAVYRDGMNGAEKNLTKSIKWYKKAAERGDLIAIYSLAEYYEKGLGVNMDKIKAYQLLMTSAREGYVSAQKKLDTLCQESPWACK